MVVQGYIYGIGVEQVGFDVIDEGGGGNIFDIVYFNFVLVLFIIFCYLNNVIVGIGVD